MPPLPSRSRAVVLGGGPAGATAARLLARQDWDVTLIEQRRFPRDKVCGAFLSFEGAALLDRIASTPALAGTGAVPIRRALLSSPTGATVGLTFPEGAAAWSLSRRRLDHRLLEAARSAGVTVREGWRARAWRPTNQGLRVTAADTATGRREDLPADLVVRATGLAGRRGGPWRGYMSPRAGGSVPEETVELHCFPGGYVGLAPLEDGTVNCCLLARDRALAPIGPEGERILQSLAFRNPVVRDRLAGSRPIAPWRAAAGIGFAAHPDPHPRVVAVGDAFAMPDPFTGEGITRALAGAALLAGALAAPGPLEAALDRYRTARADLLRRGRCGAWLRRALAAPGGTTLLFAALRAWRGLLPRLLAATRAPDPAGLLSTVSPSAPAGRG